MGGVSGSVPAGLFLSAIPGSPCQPLSQVPSMVGRILGPAQHGGTIAPGHYVSCPYAPGGEGRHIRVPFLVDGRGGGVLVLVFGRWCTDIPQRGIMWRLSHRIRRTLTKMGVETILHNCPYSTADVRSWLQAHDQHLWDDRNQTFRIRGLARTLPAAVEERTEFVRPYNPVGTTLLPSNTNQLPLAFNSLHPSSGRIALVRHTGPHSV
jgi:hypothetical protein